jgi:hypothetical protein
VHLVVVASPDGVPGLREGARLAVREGAPLSIGPSRSARLRLGGAGADLTLRWSPAGVMVLAPPSSPRASIDGLELGPGEEGLLREGSCLSIHPGLALVAGERPLVEAREPDLEAALWRAPTAEAFAVYLDFLEERGDPLARWLRTFPTASAQARRAQLGPLADAHRGRLLEASYAACGYLGRVALAREAVTQAPGLAWHLRQLARLPVARFLGELSVGLLAGPVKPETDAAVAEVLEAVAGAPFAPGLRQLCLGFTSAAPTWPLAGAVRGRLAGRLPWLPADVGQLVRRGGAARLAVLQRPPGVEVVSQEVQLNPRRTDVGGGPTCLVRLVGEVPALLCSLHREPDGQWVVWDEGQDPFRERAGRLSLRVNGVLQRRAALEPGDVVEPLAGLCLEFSMAPGPGFGSADGSP